MSSNPLSSDPFDNGAAPDVKSPIKQAAPLNPMRVLRQYWWVHLLSIVLGLVMGIGLYVVLRKYAPSYKSQAYLLVDSPLNEAFDSTREAGVIDKGAMAEIEAYIENQILLLKSTDLLASAIESPKVKLTKWYGKYASTPARVNAIGRSLRPLRMRNSTIIEVSFSADDQEDPPIVLDTLLDLFISRYIRRIESEGGQLRQMFDAQRRGRLDKINRLRQQMVQYREEHDMETLTSERTGFAVQHKRIAEELAKMKVELESLRRYYSMLLAKQHEGRIVPTPQNMARARSNITVQHREQRLLFMREQLQTLRKKFGRNHRAVKELEIKLSVINEEMDRELDQILRRMQSVQMEGARSAIDLQAQEVDGLTQEMADIHNQMMDLVSKINDYSVMEVELESEQQRLDKVTDFLDAEQIRRRRPDVSLIDIIQRSTDAELSFPSLPIIGGGTMVLVVGLATGGVFLKERLDQRIKSPQDMNSLPSAELLGVLPDADEDPIGHKQVEGVVSADPAGLMAEAFRHLRSNILAQFDQRGYKTLLVCGAQANSGVTAVVTNLALSLRLINRKVVVIDANFRRPALHELFGGEAEPGLVEVLKGTAQIDQVIQRYSEFDAEPDSDPEAGQWVGNESEVAVIPAGSANGAPPELLEGLACRSLLAELAKRYDVILIDGPPVVVATDSMLIAKNVDATALVVRAMSEKRGLVGRIMLTMKDQSSDMIGVILNGVRSSAGGYFRKNYRDFYRYREVDDRRRRRRTNRRVAVTSDT